MRPDEESRRTSSSWVCCSFPKMKGDDKNHEIRFKQIERTLKHALDEDERRIIEMKYLGNRKVKDSFVYNELMIKRDPFYQKKKVLFN